MRERPGLRLVLGLALALGAVELLALWLAFVPAPHSGGDNAGYVALARALVEGGYTEIWDPARPPHTKYPPVFPLLLALPVALGATTWPVLKLVPLLATVAFVLSVYLWVGRRRGPLFGVGVALLVGLSPAVVEAGRWILSEPPFLAFTFLALWAADRSGLRLPALGRGGEAARAEAPTAGISPDDAGQARGSVPPWAWLTLAAAGTLLAYFTRSAGLPLLLALGIALLLARRWAAAAGYAVVAGGAALVWWLRARSVGTIQYASEFWMVDPYRPELGRVGMGGLVARALDNAGAYAFRYVPEAVAGPLGDLALPLGLLLGTLALAGWGLRVRGGAGVAEVVLPLYLGVILLWPPVWSGDRFALPLLPLLLLYAGVVLVDGLGRWSRTGARVGAGVVFVALLLPALGSWAGQLRAAADCRATARTGGDYACYGPRWTEFVEAARWSGTNLPDGAVVLTRKPRIFFAQGGVPTRTFPFTTDPGAFLDFAREAGARYVLLDYVDGQATRYVGAVVGSRPQAFCSVQAFSAPGSGTRSQLLGLVPDRPDAGGTVTQGADGTPRVGLPLCPDDLRPADPSPPPDWPPGIIPLLAGVRDDG